MTTTVLRGGRIIDQTGERSGDVVVDDVSGTIVQVGPDLTADRELDASGCVVVPGLVDLQSQVHRPGHDPAQSVHSVSRAAVRGGYSAVVVMPDTEPRSEAACVDSSGSVADFQHLRRGALCDVVPAAAISVDRGGVVLAPMSEMAAMGVRLFTDSPSGVQDDRFMRRALEYAGSLAESDVVLLQRCDVDSLAAGGVMNEGEWSSRLGLPGRPAEAEELMVMRDIALVRLTGTPVHFQSVSTAGTVAMVRAAKAGALPVTAEATPPHFALDEASCASYDPRFKMQPPLRTPADVAAVRAGLADGTIDAIASGHVPHAPDALERPFDEAPFGGLGLETALAVALTELELSIEAVLALLSWQPAAIAGLQDRHGRPIREEEPGNIAVIDLECRWNVRGVDSVSGARNTPFEGRELKGKVRHTVIDGEVVMASGEVMR